MKPLHSGCGFLVPFCTPRTIHRKRSSVYRCIWFPVSKWLQEKNHILDQIDTQWGNGRQLRFLNFRFREHPTFPMLPSLLSFSRVKSWTSMCSSYTINEKKHIPEYHMSVSCEFSWQSCLLANNPNNNFHHTYLQCSSSMQLDSSIQEHLDNRSIFEWKRCSFSPCTKLTTLNLEDKGV